MIKRFEYIDFQDMMQNIYEKVLLISNWEKADYYLDDNHYIVNMPFINTEKILELNWFYRENSNTKKVVDIITLEENKEKIQELTENKFNITLLKRESFFSH